MESLSFGTPAGSETSSFLASSSKRPATAESGSLAEIMKIQDDTKARSYLTNLLGDLGVMSSKNNGGSDEEEPPPDGTWQPPAPGSQNAIITRDAFYEKLIEYLLKEDLFLMKFLFFL